MKKRAIPILLMIFFACYFLSCADFLHKPIARHRYSVKELRRLYTSGNPASWPRPALDSAAQVGFEDIGHLPPMPFPEDNPYSKEKEALGKTLFFDPRLSFSNQIACASCHDPELAWTDNRTRSFGHDRQAGLRNAMTIMNAGYAHQLFWDGRGSSLENQVTMPVEDPREMNEHIDIAAGKIAKIKGYESLFQAAFGSKQVTKGKIAMAISTFERKITSTQTKFDRFIDGEDGAYSDNEVMGLQLFRTKAGCINCHNTGYFSNNKFENDGTSQMNTKQQDLGRFLITKNPEDAGKFRVPSLREVARTGPWMHSGDFSPLRDVLTFYNAGNPEIEKRKATVYEGRNIISHKSAMLRPLNLTNEELDQLEAFLETLSSRTRRVSIPELPK